MSSTHHAVFYLVLFFFLAGFVSSGAGVSVAEGRTAGSLERSLESSLEGSHHFTYASAGMDFGSQPGVNGNRSSVPSSSSPLGPATPVAVRFGAVFPLLTSSAFCRRCCCVDFWWRFKCRPYTNSVQNSAMVLSRTRGSQINSGAAGEDWYHSCRIFPSARRTSATVMS